MQQDEKAEPTYDLALGIALALGLHLLGQPLALAAYRIAAPDAEAGAAWLWRSLPLTQLGYLAPAALLALEARRGYIAAGVGLGGLFSALVSIS